MYHCCTRADSQLLYSSEPQATDLCVLHADQNVWLIFCAELLWAPVRRSFCRASANVSSDTRPSLIYVYCSLSVSPYLTFRLRPMCELHEGIPTIALGPSDSHIYIDVHFCTRTERFVDLSEVTSHKPQREISISRTSVVATLKAQQRPVHDTSCRKFFFKTSSAEKAFADFLLFK